MKFFKPLLSICLIIIVSASYGQTTGKVQAAVFFESAKFDLSDSSKMYLKALADTLKTKLKLQISISGNTDDVGDSIFNLKLSENRSREVRRFFIENGIDSNKIKIGYNGENKPLADNSSDMGKQKNRRVDIAVKWEIPKPPEPKGDVRELMVMLANPVSTYCVAGNRDTVLFTERGTKLVILARAFGDEKVCKEECITIEFKDALGQADMIFDNLTTVSNGQLLESGGMAYINARCGKKNLRLKTPNSMFLVFPIDTFKENMKVFYGQRNSETDPMNWNQSKKDKVWTADDDFHNQLHDQMLAEAMKNRKKGCLGIGGMSKKKIEDQVKARGDELHAQMNEEIAKRIFDNDLNYIVSVSKLGWVNCDRFYSSSPINYVVNTPANNTTTSFMALNRVNSLVNGFPKDKKFQFTIPAGLAYKFVAIKYEDKKPALATMEGNTSDPSGPVVYKPFENIADLKEAIKAYFAR